MLSRDFFSRDVVEVAKDLLGCFLVRKVKDKRLVGKIVETEAYCGEDDSACHAFGGKTDRNKIMYGRAGRAYIYLIYGVHELLNFVTGSVGEPTAVLIRAVEPVEGVSAMIENRDVSRGLDLTNGPGKLTEAMDISLEQNGVDVTERSSCIFVEEKKEAKEFNFERGSRIGVEDDSLLRYYLADNDFVSC